MLTRLTRPGGRAEFARLARFLVVGGSTTAVTFLVFHAMVAALAGRPGAAAAGQALGYGVGAVVSFLANRAWTFRTTGGVRAQAARFIASQAAVLVGSSALTQAGVTHAHLAPTLAWLAVLGPTTLTNYALQRLWVFAPAPR